MTTARYWRAVAFAPYGGIGLDLELTELQLFAGSTRVDGPATISSTIAPVGGALADLKDGSTGSSCRFAADAVRAPGFSIVWDFGVSTDVDGMRFGASTVRDRFPAELILQAFVGSTWVSVGLMFAPDWPGANSLSPTISGTTSGESILNEDFAGGVPAGFAESRLDSATLTVSHDTATGAVDLDSSGYNAAWLLLQPPAVRALRVVMDAEFLTSSYGNNPAFGVTFFGGEQALTNIWWHGPGSVASYSSASSNLPSLQTLRFSVSQSVPSTGRRTYSASTKPAESGSARVYEMAGAGSDVSFEHAFVPSETMLSAAVYIRSCKVRLHSIGLFDLSTGLRRLPVRAWGIKTYAAASAPISAFSTMGSAATVARDVEFGGSDTITGRVDRYISAGSSVPQRARVSLLRARDKQLARVTWSDPATGAFAFPGVDTSRDHYVTLAEYPTNPDNPHAENYLRPVAGVSPLRGQTDAS